ncbi:MAG TPA: aspartyl protease family protein [Puia sp.]|nr:aspartyl protease family protein [Puia sp.]
MRHLLTGMFYLLLLNTQPASVQAQEGAGLPGARYLTTIRFRLLDGGIILGKARIGTFTDSLNFIFDTGCGGISLDSTTADHLQLLPRTSDLFIHGIGGVRPQRLLDNFTLHLDGISLDSLAVQVSNYDILSSVYGEKIDGIIGYGFFSRYLVKVDYDSLKMEVYAKGEFSYPKGGFLLRPQLSHLPMLEGRLNDARDIQSRFYFDTGAGLCLLLSSVFTADSVVFGPKKKKAVRTEAAGLGGRASMQLTTLRNFSLGPFRFRQIPTYIFDDSYDVTNYPQLGGLIGNDLLRRFNLILNYERSEIYLVPNANFNQPFDYSYSGIMIARLEGKIRVVGVMEDSPAKKAGLQEGDIILAINGDTGQDMSTYQSLLRSMGPRVKILVRRNDGTDARLFMKVRSIL